MRTLSLFLLLPLGLAACSSPTEIAADPNQPKRPSGFFRVVNLSSESVVHKAKVLPAESTLAAGAVSSFARHRAGPFPITVSGNELNLEIKEGATSLYILPDGKPVAISGETSKPAATSSSSLQIVNLLDKPVTGEFASKSATITARSAGELSQIDPGDTEVKVTLPDGKTVVQKATLEAGRSFVVLVYQSGGSTKVMALGTAKQETTSAMGTPGT